MDSLKKKHASVCKNDIFNDCESEINFADPDFFDPPDDSVRIPSIKEINELLFYEKNVFA